MDYPRGGSGAVVDALVRGLSKHGGELRLRSAVAEVLLSEEPGGELGRCTGVRLAGGQVVHARRAVISNAPVWQTASLLPTAARDIVRSGATGSAPLDESTPPTPSFIHLHLGIRADGLSEQARSALSEQSESKVSEWRSDSSITLARLLPSTHVRPLAGALVHPPHCRA